MSEVRQLVHLLKDGFVQFRGGVIRVALEAWVGTTLQLGGIALLFAYGASVESGAEWSVNSVETILALGIVSLALLLTAARLLFGARSRALSLTVLFEERLRARSSPPAAETPETARTNAALRSSARRRARVAGRWLTCLPLISRSIGLALFVFWLHASFSALLFVLVLGFGFLTHAPLAEDLERGLGEDDAEPLMALKGDSFERRMGERQRAMLLGDRFSAFGITTIFMAGALGAHWQSWTWTAFLAYVAAVRSLLGSLASLRKTLGWTLGELSNVARTLSVTAEREPRRPEEPPRREAIPRPT